MLSTGRCTFRATWVETEEFLHLPSLQSEQSFVLFAFESTSICYSNIVSPAHVIMELIAERKKIK